MMMMIMMDQEPRGSGVKGGRGACDVSIQACRRHAPLVPYHTYNDVKNVLAIIITLCFLCAECFVGMNLTSAQKYGSSTGCNMACQGDTGQIWCAAFLSLFLPNLP